MAITAAHVHLKVAHAALSALLPTPPKWKILSLLPTPPLCVADILPKPPLAKPSCADADERWDARKIKLASAQPPASSASGLRSADGVVRNTVGHGSPRKNATSPSPKPGRADSVERWDAHKKAASPTSSSSSSLARSSNWPISRATSAERWNVYKKSCLPHAETLDDGESISSGSNDIDDMEDAGAGPPSARAVGPPPARGRPSSPHATAGPSPRRIRRPPPPTLASSPGAVSCAAATGPLDEKSTHRFEMDDNR